MLESEGSGLDTGLELTNKPFFSGLVEKNSLIVNKFLGVAKMASTVYETQNCVAGPLLTFTTCWHTKNQYLLARCTILQVKLVNGNIYHHALWNRNQRNTICIIWVVVRISGTCDCIINDWTTPCMCESKRIKRHSWYEQNSFQLQRQPHFIFRLNLKLEY